MRAPALRAPAGPWCASVRESRVLDLKRVRPLDAAIAAVAVVVLILGGYLGYSVWSSRESVVSSTPAARAIKELEATVRTRPNDVDARMRLAQAYTVAGRDKDAVTQYKAVLTVNEEFVPAISGLGFIALKQEQYKTGEGYYRKIIELLEGNVPLGGEDTLETAYFYLGSALYEQKEYEDAASYFKEALRLRRDASDTHYALAVCYRELGSDDAYRESLENALLFDPSMPEANFDLGVILSAEGDTASAAERFRTATDAAPTAERIQVALQDLGPYEERLGAAKTLMGSDPEKALLEARVAAALESTDPEARLLVAQGYEKTGDKIKAAEAYRRVLALDAQNTTATDGLKRVTDGS